MHYYKKYNGEIILSLCALSYSFEWLFIRELGYQGLSAFDITVVRSFYTSIILIIVFILSKRNLFNFKSIKNSEYKYIITQSLLMIFCSICFNTAIKTTTVANTLVIFYSCIFWGTLFGFIFLKEKVTPKILFFILLAFIGICIALIKDRTSLSLQFGKGEFFALGGSLFFALDGVASRKIKHTNVMQRLLIVNVLATVIASLYIFSFLSPSLFKILFSQKTFLYGFALALFCGFIAKGLMYAGYNRTPVSIALVILLLEPIFQMTTAYFIASEKISLINVTGIIIVFIMVFLISLQKTKKT